MEIAKARCPKNEYHRVWLDGRKVYVQDSGGGRRCANTYGPDATDAGHAMAIAQSFLATLCTGR
jgi:hypothetical protein